MPSTTTQPPTPNPRPPHYWLRLLTWFSMTLAVVLAGTPLLLGFLMIWGLIYPPCAEAGLTPRDFGFTYEDVTLSARAGGSFRGYLVPGNNRAAVIVVPGFNSGRDSRLREAMLLARQGYTVFAFESRRCAGMGGLSLGYKEVDEVADALAYLQSRREVDPQRIGVFGFSSAGATAIMATARLPQLKAVVAEGGYGDFPAETLTPAADLSGVAAYFQTTFYWSARQSYNLLTGMDINLLSPVDVIGRISPRPILLIYGSREVSLPGARRQQAATGQNATLWVVEGAGHGNYFDVAPQEYEKRLVAFFDRSLGSEP